MAFLRFKANKQGSGPGGCRIIGQLFAVFLFLIAIRAPAAESCSWIYQSRVEQMAAAYARPELLLKEFRERVEKQPDLALLQEVLQSQKPLEIIREGDRWAYLESPVALDRVSAVIFNETLGRRILWRSIFKITDPALRERVMARAIQEQLLVYGLKGIIKQLPAQQQVGVISKMKVLFQKLMHSKVGTITNLAMMTLPRVHDIRIPDALLEKILMDGVKAHQKELDKLLDYQPARNYFNRIRPILNFTLFAIYVALGHQEIKQSYLAFEKTYERMVEEARQEKKDEYQKPISRIEAELELRKQVVPTQYRIFFESLAGIQQKAQRAPQPAEIQLVYKQIFADRDAELSQEQARQVAIRFAESPETAFRYLSQFEASWSQP